MPDPDERRVASTRDGRALQYVSRGSGHPTVVFEAGMGSPGRGWELVLAAVAERTRAVAYDRAGLGASPADAAPRTLERATADLLDLLGHLGTGPFVLVGHSYGGPIVRNTAAAAPELVAGLVLVDQTDELCELYFARSSIRQQRMMAAMLPVAARTGLLHASVKRAARPLPPGAADQLARESSTPAAARAFQAELEPMIDDLTRLRDEPPLAPSVPVTLISGTRRARFGAAVRTALVAAHEQRAASLPRGRHVRAERSGHLVMFSEPDLVTVEILRVIAEGDHREGEAEPA